jgi:hypothetical protein
MKLRVVTKILMLVPVGGLMLASGAWAAGTVQASGPQPTPCITPSGAIYSVNCAGGSADGGVGDDTSVPSPAVTAGATPSPSPSLTPGVIPSPEATATPSVGSGSGSGSGSNLPDTGALTAVSGAIGLSAIGFAGWKYWQSRKLDKMGA